MSTYERTRRERRARWADIQGTRGPIRSVYFTRKGAVFSTLYIAAKCNPGRFCRAPKAATS
jgi:hypothetical protein